MSDYHGTSQELLGEILRKFRKENGYTQQRIADYLALGRSTYSKYEEASRKPEIDVIIKLAALYGVSVDEFLDIYADKAINEKNVKSFAKASSPENKDGTNLTRDELKLLALFRKSIRKGEILGYARQVADEDSKASENLND